ncbi:MAG: FAD-dependent oxidoreductase [Clostridia bacterium]|nr:FAD-dependent oxidoreductase [Clostridia bacterium]
MEQMNLVPVRDTLSADVLVIGGGPAGMCAAGAIRAMPPCMGMGQAAGTAAALAVRHGVTPRQLDARLLCRRPMDNKAYL